MGKTRLEAFSDGVLAIIITIMVLEKISPILYLAAIPLAFVHQAIAGALYVLVALIWLVPDRRIERVVTTPHS